MSLILFDTLYNVNNSYLKTSSDNSLTGKQLILFIYFGYLLRSYLSGSNIAGSFFQTLVGSRGSI